MRFSGMRFSGWTLSHRTVCGRSTARNVASAYGFAASFVAAAMGFMLSVERYDEQKWDYKARTKSMHLASEITPRIRVLGVTLR